MKKEAKRVKIIVCVDLEKVRKFADRHWRIFNQNKQQDWTIQDEYVYLAAMFNDRVVGYTKFRVRGGVVDIESLLVHEAKTKKGIGSLLMQHIEKHARIGGCKKLVLETSEIHKEAINFYHQHGFKRLAVLPDMYFGLEWYIYAKELKVGM